MTDTEDITPTHAVVAFRDKLEPDESYSPATTLGTSSLTPTQASLKVGNLTFIRSGIDAITYAAAMLLDPNVSSLHAFTTTSVVGNATVNASSPGTPGQIIYFIITNDASSGRTITFGTNFSASATLVGTSSKTATIGFISNGTKFYELFRTTGLT